MDTRNVAATELVVAVGNIADTPPYFVDAAPVTRLPENAGVGDFVMDIVARHDATLKSNSKGAATERWIFATAASQNGVCLTQQMCHIYNDLVS